MYCKTANNQEELEVRARRVSKLSEEDELTEAEGRRKCRGECSKQRDSGRERLLLEY